MYALLADELVRLLVQLGPQIAAGNSVSALAEQAKLVGKGSPDGDLAHDVVLHFKLLHLPVAHRAILALEELLLHLMPRANVLPFECNLNSIEARNLAFYSQKQPEGA